MEKVTVHLFYLGYMLLEKRQKLIEASYHVPVELKTCSVSQKVLKDIFLQEELAKSIFDEAVKNNFDVILDLSTPLLYPLAMFLTAEFVKKGLEKRFNILFDQGHNLVLVGPNGYEFAEEDMK